MNLTREELEKIDDIDLVLKDLPFGVVAGLGHNPSELQQVSAVIALTEMQRRFKNDLRRFNNSTERYNKLMIWLTVIMAILGIIQIISIFKPSNSINEFENHRSTLNHKSRNCSFIRESNPYFWLRQGR